MKKFVLGLIVGCVLSVSVVSFAAEKMNIEVAKNSILLKVNGNEVQKENFIYKGTTFVPLRAVGEMLNMNIVWNANTKTAEVNSKDYASETDTSATEENSLTPSISEQEAIQKHQEWNSSAPVLEFETSEDELMKQLDELSKDPQ